VGNKIYTDQTELSRPNPSDEGYIDLKCRHWQHSLGAAKSCSFWIPTSSGTTPSTSRRLHVTEPVARKRKWGGWEMARKRMRGW